MTDTPPAATPSAEPPPPTPAQAAAAAQAAGAAAGAAVERGATAQEVRAIVQEEVARVRDGEGFALTDAHISKMADGVMNHFEAAGAFEKAVPAPPPAGDASAAAAASAAVGAPVTPPAEGDPPRKSTFADRFLNMGQR